MLSLRTITDMKKLFLLLVSLLSISAIGQGVTTPILSVTPKTGDFYGVQLVETSASIQFTIKNTGISILKIKKIEVIGNRFSLTDTNTYPFEVVADTGVSFPEGNNGKTLKFTVHFVPTAIGIQTGKVVITYGLWSDEIYEIPLTGEGLSCSSAKVANKGENWAPKQNIWFKYTADKFSIVEVNTCHPHQQIVGSDTWEIWLYLYSDCQGTLLAGGAEPTGTCPFNREAVLQMTVMEAGETIYIFCPQGFPNSPHVNEGFYFNINVTYPVDGDVCENAIPLTLPVVNLFGNTRGLQDDYNYSPCSVYPNYMDGNDIVYTITLPEDGYLTGNILGAYGSIHVLDMCPKTELTKDHCKAFVGGPNGGQFRKKIAAGTYFVIISNWAPPQTLDYLLNLSWEGTSAVENESLVNTLNVFPNPAQDKFTISVTSGEAMDLMLELVNLSGQSVYRHELKSVFGIQEEIETSGFAKGVYYLKVNTGKDTAIRKVIIQ